MKTMKTAIFLTVVSVITLGLAAGITRALTLPSGNGNLKAPILGQSFNSHHAPNDRTELPGWSIQVANISIPQTPVPDGGTTAVLLGIGMLALSRGRKLRR